MAVPRFGKILRASRKSARPFDGAISGSCADVGAEAARVTNSCKACSGVLCSFSLSEIETPLSESHASPRNRRLDGSVGARPFRSAAFPTQVGRLEEALVHGLAHDFGPGANARGTERRRKGLKSLVSGAETVPLCEPDDDGSRGDESAPLAAEAMTPDPVTDLAASGPSRGRRNPVTPQPTEKPRFRSQGRRAERTEPKSLPAPAGRAQRRLQAAEIVERRNNVRAALATGLLAAEPRAARLDRRPERPYLSRP